MSSATRLRKWGHMVPGVDRAYYWILRRTRPRFEHASQSLTPMPGTFADILLSHKGRAVHKWLHYCAIYDEILGPFRTGFLELDGGQRPLKFLEIGVLHGGSLEVWRRYFGAAATILGIDIDPQCAVDPPKEVQVRVGSQGDPEFLKKVVEEMGGVDVVLDDGSHIASLQRKSFDALFPLLSPGGLYIVEDTLTAYSLSFGGGFRRPGTIVQVAKGMVDGLHKAYFRWPVGRRARLAHRDVWSIRFYESVIVFQKAPRHRPQPGEFGGDRPTLDVS